MVEIPISEEDVNALEIEHNNLTTDPQKHWHFDESRREVIKSWDDVQACPGSGKTTLVAAKLLILAMKWKEPHSGICVLTHTNVARDEIISRLHNHPAGFRLTSYPHFIGTIQEFVNRFIGLPYVRTQYEFNRLIEDAEGQLQVRRAQIDGYTIDDICKNLRGQCNWASNNEITAYLGSLHFINAVDDLRFFRQHNTPENSLHDSNSARRRMLFKLKEAMCNAGIFQFRDMYAFAEKLIVENPSLPLTLRKRFPLVIIDEMQDTQNFQDTLINQVFSDQSVKLQRLGDPDQAIFDGIGGDEPNQTFNDNDNLEKITTTHRFGEDICDKIIGLSYSKINELSSERNPNRGECPHTIFLYDNDSRENVLEAFGNLVDQADPESKWGAINAVGGVEGSSGHISEYWPKFDRSKTASSPRPKKLIHIVHLCSDQSQGHVSKNYDLLVQGIVDLLRKANVRTENKDGNMVYFSRQSLYFWLRENNKHPKFRKFLTSMLLEANLSVDGWNGHVDALKEILELNALDKDASEYLEHDVAPNAAGDEHAPATNTYTCANGQKIEVGTIHSVKGETHDATLILETKFHENDVQQLLQHIIEPGLDRPVGNRNKDFMRKLYVAASRPRHLLCIAMHKDHISDEQIDQLKANGWIVPPALEVDG